LAQQYARANSLQNLGYRSLADGFRYNSTVVTHVVDEIHELKRPEILYPFIDKGMTFVFCTNETTNLTEPLRNRCVERFLAEYSLVELIMIAGAKYPELSNGALRVVAERSRGVPRIVLQLAFLSTVNCKNLDAESVEKYLDSTGIYANGFTRLDLKYLDFLKKVKKASLTTLRSNLNVPDTQIKDEIEPYLIRQGLISITGSGRIYTGDDK
jgi:holliday junction DNA helicase RuvB